jgi:prolyl oligopeptidase
MVHRLASFPCAIRLPCTVSFAPSPCCPLSQKVAHVDRMFGMKFSDNYHWMEDGGLAFETWLTAARVSSWMPAKFAAGLQAATAGPRPVLLRVNDAGGHGAGTRAQAQAEEADFYSFLFWQAGVPGFQPP